MLLMCLFHDELHCTRLAQSLILFSTPITQACPTSLQFSNYQESAVSLIWKIGRDWQLANSITEKRTDVAFGWWYLLPKLCKFRWNLKVTLIDISDQVPCLQPTTREIIVAKYYQVISLIAEMNSQCYCEIKYLEDRTCYYSLCDEAFFFHWYSL